MFGHCPGPVSLFRILCLLTFLVAGCGGKPTRPTSPSGPVPGESTTVAIQVSSTDKASRLGGLQVERHNMVEPLMVIGPDRVTTGGVGV
jgi:hypothetical protein